VRLALDLGAMVFTRRVTIVGSGSTAAYPDEGGLRGVG